MDNIRPTVMTVPLEKSFYNNRVTGRLIDIFKLYLEILDKRNGNSFQSQVIFLKVSKG
jgi:hypothetical protein